MRPETWQVVQEIFHAAAAVPAGPEREALLDERCSDDAEIRGQVCELLSGSDGLRTTFLEPPTVRLDPDAPRHALLSGTTVGSCQLGSLIGEGGMGAVYAGAQQPTGRPVAVKVMRSLGHGEARRRFDFEAKVLANLRHPGIAQVYEAGTHEDGSGLVIPFIVMEFVDGARTLTEWCDEKNLDVRARCEIVEQVCDAVHHGHLKAVIHRDLKPANLLVDAEGRTKVIDFGVARVTDSDSWDKSFQTIEGIVVGTPAYMSPEQLGGHHDDLDARTDVYSLGAVLYELITGERPHGSQAQFDEFVRSVRDDPAPRPSRLVPGLSADLDTVVTTALAKDRQRRYASAAALGQDLANWRLGHPIQARPLTLGYQLKMFARRNRALVASGIVIFVVLVVAAVVSSLMAVKASRAEAAERSRADDAERIAEKNSEFSEWVARQFQIKLAELPGATPLRRELLEHVTTWLDDITTDETTAQLRRTVARSYIVAAEVEGSGTGFSDPTRALATNDKALALLEHLAAEIPDDSSVALDLAKTRIQRAGFLMETTRQAEVEGALVAAEATLDALANVPAHAAEVKNFRASITMTRANVHRDAGNWKEAIADMASAVAILGHPDSDDATLADWSMYLDWRFIQLQAMWQHGDEAGARKIWNELDPVIQRVAPKADLSVSARAFRARAAQTKGDFESFADRNDEAALLSYGESERLLQGLHDADPANTGFMQSLGIVLSRRGKLLFSMKRMKEALPVAERELALQRTLHTAAPDSERTQLNLRVSLSHIGLTVLFLGDVDRAMKYATEAFELAQDLLDADPDGIDQQTAMAEAHGDMGTTLLRRLNGTDEDLDTVKKARTHYAKAVRLYRRVLEAAPNTWGVKSRIEMNETFLGHCDKLLGGQ